jgi:hypothetical protein
LSHSFKETELRKHYTIELAVLSILIAPLWQPAHAATAAADTARAPVSGHPALWMKAVEVYEMNKNLVPGKMVQKTQELNDKGQVKSEGIIELSLSLDPAGKIKNAVVKASKNGKDTTKDEKKEADERARKAGKEKGDSDENSHSFSYSESPFSAKVQSDVRVTETNIRETVGTISCVCFDFVYPEKREPGAKGKPAMIKGRTWIDESSGRPMKLQYTTDPLPKHVKNFVNTLLYDAGDNGSWILKELTFDASGSFLFINKRFHGDLLFSNHFVYVEPPSAK